MCASSRAARRWRRRPTVAPLCIEPATSSRSSRSVRREHLFEGREIRISVALRATQLVPPPDLDFDLSRYDWHDAAACRGLDSEIFFPEKGQPTLRAKAACAVCPVREQCLEHALETDAWGVWAGSSLTDRRKLKTADESARLEWLDKQARCGSSI